MADPGQLPFDPIEEARRHWLERWPGVAAPSMVAVTSIMRVHQILMARLNELLEPFGLTFPRYEVLMLLHFSRQGSMQVGKIGEASEAATEVLNAASFGTDPLADGELDDLFATLRTLRAGAGDFSQ